MTNEVSEIIKDESIKTEANDRLNRKQFASIIVNLVTQNVKPPFSVGIYGGWGTGKTTILNFIEEELKEKNKSEGEKYKVVRFEAWKYENESNLIYPLLRILEDEGLSKRRKIRREIKKEIKKLSFVVTKGLLEISLKASTLGILDILKLETYEEKYLSKFSKWVDAVRKDQNHFEKIVNAVLGENHKLNHKLLVILVDDLDRCLPENSIRVLESIKNFLISDKCIFILALDKEAVANGIKNRYPTLSEEDCKEYLDKIITFNLDIPEIESDSYKEYIKDLCGKLSIELGDEFFNNLSVLLVTARLHNPRKVKRVLNRYFIIRTLQPSLPDEVRNKYKNDDLMYFLILKEFWPQLFIDLLEYRDLLADLHQVFNKRMEERKGLFGPDRAEKYEKYLLDENLANFVKTWARYYGIKTYDEAVKEFWKVLLDTLIKVTKFVGLKA